MKPQINKNALFEKFKISLMSPREPYSNVHGGGVMGGGGWGLNICEGPFFDVYNQDRSPLGAIGTISSCTNEIQIRQ